MVSMSNAPSYKELKYSECFWLQLTPSVAGMNETLDGCIEDEPVITFMYYESNVSAVEEGFEFPYSDIRIRILEKSNEEVCSLSGKYPIGYISCDDESASITLMCRTELFTRMVSTLGMIKENEIEFLVTLPEIPESLPNVYPVLNFQYRVRASSRNQDA